MNKLVDYPNYAVKEDKIYSLKFNKERELKKGIDAYGYEVVKVAGKWRKAHRLLYMGHHGLTEKEMSKKVVMHVNDKRSDNSIDNLMLGTQADNVRDMVRKGRNKTKLTKEQVVEIRKRKKPVIQLAKDFGIHWRTVYHIINRDIWKGV